MDSIRINTAQNIDIEYEIAGLGERIAARCIDLAGFAILFVVAWILFVIGSISVSGTLGVYLRLLDIPIPGSYGPSADDQSF